MTWWNIFVCWLILNEIVLIAYLHRTPPLPGHLRGGRTPPRPLSNRRSNAARSRKRCST